MPISPTDHIVRARDLRASNIRLVLALPPAVRTIFSLNRSIVLVTGETGFGKSTALAAMPDRINHTGTDHIMTLEDSGTSTPPNTARKAAPTHPHLSHIKGGRFHADV